METDWDRSAEAWLAHLGGTGDMSRRLVLDGPLRARVLRHRARTLLDVGCGDGRFCRMLGRDGVACTGLDPTERFLEAARSADPSGVYENGVAEALPFEDGVFEAVVSYLSLIDISDARAGLAEMARVLAPGGILLIANLQGFATASQIKGRGFRTNADGSRTMTMHRYLEEHTHEAAWRGIRVINYHRPQSLYMETLLGLGLRLTWFAEPPARGAIDAVEMARADAYNHAPYLYAMEWERPA